MQEQLRPSGVLQRQHVYCHERVPRVLLYREIIFSRLFRQIFFTIFFREIEVPHFYIFTIFFAKDFSNFSRKIEM